MSLSILVKFVAFSILYGDLSNRYSKSTSWQNVGVFGDTIQDHPYLVSIELIDENATTQKVLCSGTILSNRSVLVTGKCAYEIDQKNFAFVEIRANSNSTGLGTTTGDILKPHSIKGCREENCMNNSVSVVCSNAPFDFIKNPNKPIDPIKQDEKILSGSNATVAGWGDSETGFPHEIRAFEVTILEQRTCIETYPEFVESEHVCAQKLNEVEPTLCEGDLAAPLVKDGMLIGIVNRYSRICSGVWPDIYFNIAHVSDEILKFKDECDTGHP
ncbi:hypothetical protein QAD02_009235 [Eretmocerus hayati]|uniref:Uncharacterized protein n=1 Tax=Eretmocerus hayati TaxID=131215 RepID=A0ACC2NB44_9HYME|nr:hypothetical protein QAD02_009235 [Eretmocerus hayati]